MLPAVRNSSEIYGYTDREIFGGEVPIAELPETSRLRCSGSAALRPEM